MTWVRLSCGPIAQSARLTAGTLDLCDTCLILFIVPNAECARHSLHPRLVTTSPEIPVAS
jgi:hypothetical protein